eukprot:NODE_91_length_21779_cov_0.171356.p12 type:complete len:186 gc:universal NODE_91_length_21779_cov_0.171356:9883-9326(-)
MIPAIIMLSCYGFKPEILYPYQILFIRHAEKTKSDPIHLSKQGVERAEQLPDYMSKLVSKGIISKPDHLISMKQQAPQKSNRPFETLVPLSKHLNLEIHNEYTSDEIDQLFSAINNKALLGKVVLVCWSHDNLPAIAQRFGMPVKNWKKKDFNSVWLLTNYIKYSRFELYSMYDAKSKNDVNWVR